MDTGQQAGHQADDGRVQRQGSKTQGEHGERQREPHQDRPHQSVEQAEQRRGGEGRPDVVDGEAGQHPGEQEQRPGRHEPHDQDPPDRPQPDPRLAHDAICAGTTTGTFGAAITTRQSGATTAAWPAKSRPGVT